MQLLTGLIVNIQKYSIHDGPGIRTTVFFKGCPLHCRWCHNPESQAPGQELMVYPGRCIGCQACLSACRLAAISMQDGLSRTDYALCDNCGDCVDVCYAQAREIIGREATVAEVMAEIQKDTTFYDESGGGVTYSGGEPLHQPDFLLALLKACNQNEIHTALDTCGFAAWNILDRVRDYVDLFLFDLKMMDDALHREFTGISNKLILENLRKLSERGHDIVLRLPIIPEINDGDQQVRQIGEFAATLPHLKEVNVLPYHLTAVEKYRRLNKVYALPDVHPPSDERMVEIVHILRDFGLLVRS